MINTCDIIKTLSQPELKAYMLEGARQTMPPTTLETMMTAMKNTLGNVNVNQTVPLGPLTASVSVRGFPPSTTSALLRGFGMETGSSNAFNNNLIDRLGKVDPQLTIQNGRAQIKPKIELQLRPTDIPANARFDISSPEYCSPQACVEPKCTNLCSPKIFGKQICTQVCSPRLCTPKVCWPSMKFGGDVTGIYTMGDVTMQPTIEHVCKDVSIAAGDFDGQNNSLLWLSRQVPPPRMTDVAVTMNLNRTGTRISQTSLNALRSVLDNVRVQLPWATTPSYTGLSAADAIDRAINTAALPRIESGVSGAFKNMLK